MFARFRAAHDQLAAKEFLVVQLSHRSFGFVDRLHLHKGKAFRPLVVAVTDHLGILHVTNAGKELKQIALRCVEGKVANVKTWRCYFDRLWFTRGPRN